MIAADFLQPKYNVNEVIVSWYPVVPDMDLDQVRQINAMMHDKAMQTRDGIEAFGRYIAAQGGAIEENPFPVFHSFNNGVYAREIHIKKGYFLVGKLHKHESTVEMLKGKALVADETGTRIIKAPAQFVSKPGIKRIGFIIEDIVWIDRHKTDATTVEAAEKDIFTDNYDEIEDYDTMVRGLGFTPEEVEAMSDIKEDMIPWPKDSILEVRDSKIHGKGCFTKEKIETGNVAGVARVGFNRTPLGRYANHSFKPNAKCDIKNNTLYFVATRDISTDEEITVDYRDVRKAAGELDEMLNTNSNAGWSSCQAQ